MIFSTSILFLVLLPLSAAYSCIPPRHVPPLPRHCHILIDALELLSTNPPYNRPLLWSRHANDTTTSLRLPKSYRLISQFPNSCAIHIDAAPANLDAEDVFTLSSVGNMAEIVVEQCLVRQKKLGWGFPGVGANIQVIVVRMDGLWRGDGVEGWRSVGLEVMESMDGVEGGINGTEGGDVEAVKALL